MDNEVAEDCYGAGKIQDIPYAFRRHATSDIVVLQGFYNPIDDSFIEPDKTGISYSFTADGFYEEAYYRAVANPTNPKCPEGIMQWQHGSWVFNANGSLSLTPIAVDGRQLTSAPCEDENHGIYVRYNQSELMKVSYTLPQEEARREREKSGGCAG